MVMMVKSKARDTGYSPASGSKDMVTNPYGTRHLLAFLIRPEEQDIIFLKTHAPYAEIWGGQQGT
jgi:hypothetical protein